MGSRSAPLQELTCSSRSRSLPAQGLALLVDRFPRLVTLTITCACGDAPEDILRSTSLRHLNVLCLSPEAVWAFPKPGSHNLPHLCEVVVHGVRAWLDCVDLMNEVCERLVAWSTDGPRLEFDLRTGAVDLDHWDDEPDRDERYLPIYDLSDADLASAVR